MIPEGSNLKFLEQNYAIGIDLGISYCRACLFDGEKFMMIPNEINEIATPSYISFTETGVLVGQKGKDEILHNPQNTIFNIKRLVGQRFSDLQVQEDIKNLPFIIEQGPGDKPLIVVELKKRIFKFYPEEIYSFLIEKIIENAESLTKQPVNEVVVTVPAYFNRAQIYQTIKGCSLDSVKVLRTIKESQAIALGLYSLQNITNEKIVLVYKAGGGSLDVSIISIQDQIFEVKAMSGDNHLGGEDFLQRIVEFCLEEFKLHSKVDLSGDKNAVLKLRQECENARKKLTTDYDVMIKVPRIYSAYDLKVNFSRKQFEELCYDLFQRCIQPIVSAMKDAKVNAIDIHDIVIVGGLTRTPRLNQILEDLFKNKNLVRPHNHHDLSAYGAALEAGIVMGKMGPQFQNLLQIDATSYGLGIEVDNGKMQYIINRNTAFPTTKSVIFTTSKDYQSEFPIRVYEGQSEDTKFDLFLGEFKLINIQPSFKGVPRIEIKFDIDGQRNLTVTASEMGTLNRRYIKIDSEWISKINFQKEAEIKNKNVIFQENVFQPISIQIYKKESQIEMMSDV
ncbi:UNKNOWN [Stylonychia lemnae]|uniref:Heat shock protein 70 n=1 Tax=Stylonychia lemnae TaxID=5949 RepID=A0A078BDJ7_STYLE|nr:UNKNOWN [Stylonychia lemnae]|eukprot:CDW91663.1 UNKNOWN [Stylonychia lemnae]